MKMFYKNTTLKLAVRKGEDDDGDMFELLPGFRDFYPEACATRNRIFQGWRTVAQRFGFEEFDGPILETLDLFTKKSGDEIVEQLFAFQDRGGRSIALRPEMTPSLVRILGQQWATLKMPTKWFNITENFRYERPQKGRLRSFYQFNVDIIGEATYTAEAELIALAIDSFQWFGLTREHFYIRLSDRQLWTLWMEAWGLHSEELQAKMLSIFDKWERRSTEDIQQDLLKILPETVSAQAFFEKTEQLRGLNTLEAIRVHFLAQNLNTNQQEALEQRLTVFQQLLEQLSAMGCENFITIDLTIVRGLAYYTGFVFEVFEAGNQGRALAGGGRYDQLFEKLTGHALPAVGFASGDVTLTDLLQKQQLLPQYKKAIDVYILFDPSERLVALKYAQQLRHNVFSVEYPLGEVKSFAKQLKKAYALNPTHILIFTPEDVLLQQVQIRTPGENLTQVLPLDKILDYLGEKTKL